MILDTTTETRLQEVKDSHAKRHPACTPDTCHTQWLIATVDALKNRIGNAAFLLELHKL